MSDQGVRNKFSRDSFSVSDLIKICNALDCELSIRTRNAQIVYLGMEDLKEAGNKTKDAEPEKTDIDYKQEGQAIFTTAANEKIERNGLSDKE